MGALTKLLGAAELMCTPLMMLLVILFLCFAAKDTIYKLTKTLACETKDKSLTGIQTFQKGAEVKCPSVAEKILLLTLKKFQWYRGLKEKYKDSWIMTLGAMSCHSACVSQIHVLNLA